MDIRVTGGDELAALGRRVRAAGDAGLRRSFRDGLTEAARPATEAGRASARRVLPAAGGLAERVARGRFTARVRGTDLAVTAQAGLDLPALDAGLFRHPVHGHRDRWVPQHVTPGWWTRAMQEQADTVAAAVAAQVAKMLDKL